MKESLKWRYLGTIGLAVSLLAISAHVLVGSDTEPPQVVPATTAAPTWGWAFSVQKGFPVPALTPTVVIHQDAVNDLGQAVPLPIPVRAASQQAEVQGFTMVTVTLVVQDEGGVPVQNALVKAFSEDWGVRYPFDWGAFYTTDQQGRTAFRLPAGDWTFFAAGGDAYKWGRAGHGLFALLRTTVNASTTLILQPDNMLTVTLRGVDGNVLEADDVYLMESNHIPRVPFPITGRTQGGRIILHTSAGAQYDLLLLKRPDSTPGYFLHYPRQPAGGSLDVRPTRSDLALVHFRAYDRLNQPTTLNAMVTVAWLDMDRMHGFFDFNVVGQADLYVTPQRIRLNYRNLSTPDWYYVFVGKYYNLQPGSETIYNMGGPVSAEVKALGKERDTQLWLPVRDTFDNQMDFFSGPGGVSSIPITLTHQGATIYTGTLTGLGGRIEQAYTQADSPQYQIDLDLGPPYGRFNLTGTLLSPTTAYGWEVTSSAHFNLYTPYGFPTQTAALSAELEVAYEHLSDYLGEDLSGKIAVYIEPWPTSAGWGGTNVVQAWFGGFRWHHPQWPAGIFEPVVWHELGHVFQFTPPLLHGVECPWFCEPWATYLGSEVIEALQGEQIAGWHRSNHVDFLKYIDGGEASEVERMQFILFYLRNQHGTEIHRNFVHLWADPTAPAYKDQLLGAGFTTKETIITLYSCLADQNLAWLFQLGGFEVTEARVDQGLSLTGCICSLFDFDRDGEVDASDIMLIAAQWRMTNTNVHWDSRYDMDGNNVIDVVDVMMVATHWGERCFEPQLLNLQTDPDGDWISPMPRSASMDIRQTSVWLVDDNHLRFEMQLDGVIPAVPSGSRFYGWLLDTDLSTNTGQQYNDIGSDYNVQVTYFPDRGWVGQVFDIGGVELVELSSITVREDVVTFTVPLSSVGSPSTFNWISIDQDDVPYYADVAPNSGHVRTELPGS